MKWRLGYRCPTDIDLSARKEGVSEVVRVHATRANKRSVGVVLPILNLGTR
jgi:hypothetical protein